MISFIEIVFYITGFLCGYSYFVYPFVLKVIKERQDIDAKTLQDQEGDSPKVSLIITVHNEEKRITEKLLNTLEIDYPATSLQIIVASDQSTDGTEEIVKSFSDKGVELVRADARKGKEYAQLCAIKSATGDIVVFSDVATSIPKDALNLLVDKYSNTAVGAVSSEDQFVSDDGKLVGEGVYVKYEMWLRRLESTRGGLVGLSGSFFSARKEMCDEWDIYSPSDFNVALTCARKGKIAITCPEVVGIYKDVKDKKLEFSRKVRTVIRGVTAISRHSEVLNPFKFGLFSFQVWSHKIMRWAVPWFMLIFFVTNLLLLGESSFYQYPFAAQLLFYFIALIGWITSASHKYSIVRIIYFFVQTNIALAQATLSFAFGKRMYTWTPSKR
ncbi:MAG: glycosyltransferase family 2 protein [Candidatus Thiodiazotropha lotti]|uniref:Glycosyltransferase family 2 protein n=1 Tax=Candidatus Thiodiazotropha lotti TaxID=2792787 RepID=A0A9E4MY96_9GAMM|nr:glycosyltransferase family 2 protein [Candidatus Thiodiazotropha lotti]ODC00666.1 glycosyl transferase [Candidatus Thiodiazotropha endoloripes]MCG7920145.1 glycosyltransferase family 2 protein [Candidatus Thiodiazotropha lotti]MCG7928512.1 glycosyltransferase family 2 protein [Candidatus Thiodiazotropha lotti]MCG7938237.1 glycosyltransferase family 2 protein [Candidatus Thiodiazotropha lotti]